MVVRCVFLFSNVCCSPTAAMMDIYLCIIIQKTELSPLFYSLFVLGWSHWAFSSPFWKSLAFLHASLQKLYTVFHPVKLIWLQRTGIVFTIDRKLIVGENRLTTCKAFLKDLSLHRLVGKAQIVSDHQNFGLGLFQIKMQATLCRHFYKWDNVQHISRY